MSSLCAYLEVVRKIALAWLIVETSRTITGVATGTCEQRLAALNIYGIIVLVLGRSPLAIGRGRDWVVAHDGGSREGRQRVGTVHHPIM